MAKIEPSNQTADLDVVDALITDVRGVPEGLLEPRIYLRERSKGKALVRVFVSYAQTDALSHKLIDCLRILLESSPRYSFELWRDIELLAGERWEQRLLEALDACHLGLMLLSPAFFASEYIGEVELPAFVSGHGPGVEGKRLLPVELRAISPCTTDTRGLKVHQIFRGPRGTRSPFPTRKSEKRDTWMKALVEELHRVLDRYATEEPPDPPHPVRSAAMGRQTLSPDLSNVEAAGCLIEDAHGNPVSLDASTLDQQARTAQTPGSVPALDYILDWLRDPEAPALFALLGEYGMGKTITCQRVVKAIETAEGEGEALPTPLYFDLRRLTSLRRGDEVPLLEDILRECIDRGWPLQSHKPSVDALFAQAASQPTLFIFDGLDEALVHLSDANGKQFTRELLRVRELSTDTASPTRVLISCRTHYFRSFSEQNAHFSGQDRGDTRTRDYAALVLLPLSEAQIQHFLAKALPEVDVERATTLVRSVHDLEELAARPYTLRLIGQLIPDIEHRRARGEVVRSVTLYDSMVEQWLNRDAGKHHIKPAHKRRLMRHLAAWTWRRGSRLVPAEALEDWFSDWLARDQTLGRRYASIDRDKLEEDLRTATFLVREDESVNGKLRSGFRFAHSSMQEFFLSGYLFDAVESDAPAAWDLEDASVETWKFFAQRLDGPEIARRLATLETWARGGPEATRWLLLRYVLSALERGWDAPSMRGADLSGVSLQGQTIHGPADFSDSSWADASLRQTRWIDVQLEAACFARADLRYSEWDGVNARAVDLEGARVDGAVFHRVDLEGAKTAGGRGLGARVLLTKVPSGWLERPQIAPSPCADASCSSQVEHGHCFDVTACVWSHDGSRALSSGSDGSIFLWDIDAGHTIASWQTHQGSVRSCAWSHDDRRASTSGSDGTIHIWEIGTGLCVASWQAHRCQASSCAWSRDDRHLLSAGSDGSIHIWDIESAASLASWQAHQGTVSSCAWSPDGRHVLSSGDDGRIHIWDIESASAVASWQSHQGTVSSCAWSPDGRRILFSGYDDTIRLWDLDAGTAITSWQARQGIVWSCSWSHDGRRALSTGYGGSIQLWDVDTASLLGSWRAHQGTVSSCAWSPDDRRALFTGRDGSIQLWDIDSASTIALWQPRKDPVWACALSPDGRRAASAGDDGCLRLWDIDAAALLASWPAHRGRVSSCVWSPDGRRLLSAGDDGTIQLWDVDAASPVASPIASKQAHRGRISSCAWSPDGRRVFSVGDDGSSCVWDIDAAGPIASWQAHQGPISSCAWSHDGRRALFSSDDETIRLWDVDAASTIASWSAHQHIVRSCAWSPDDRRALSSGYDGSIQLWDVDAGISLAPWQAHRGPVWSCAWSPDGRYALSSGYDGTIRLWDIDAASAIASWHGHLGPVRSCAWSPDGRRALSSSYDGTLRLWDVDTGSALLVMATFDDEHATFIPGPRSQGGRIIQASKNAWRWLRWKATHPDGTTELLPAEIFGELPSP
ncbi:PD40 domain-containing protein [Pseudenhygromyxa sp. WMMC2535]|uniref:WD40 domain-containing protein n=1 Tax=Pseudenhygromyxa sp. WMMC2535 TaxID=2712867 RepID=UPI00155763FF|nr:NACHT domain-containing protein [Pseudenhygromyxa sp. WMMC2535]NVB37296.1 PD40 domain-containing protein [Pseudenhygromyxa sp. WMMC2535]